MGTMVKFKESFWNYGFSMLWKRPFWIERALSLFAEKGRDLDPQDPSPSCVPAEFYVLLLYSSFFAVLKVS